MRKQSDKANLAHDEEAMLIFLLLEYRALCVDGCKYFCQIAQLEEHRVSPEDECVPAKCQGQVSAVSIHEKSGGINK